MRRWVELIYFIGGNVLYDNNGAYYDHDLETIIKIYFGDSDAWLLKIVHRNPLSAYGRTQYVAVPFRNGADVSGLIELALMNVTIGVKIIYLKN